MQSIKTNLALIITLAAGAKCSPEQLLPTTVATRFLEPEKRIVEEVDIGQYGRVNIEGLPAECFQGPRIVSPNGEFILQLNPCNAAFLARQEDLLASEAGESGNPWHQTSFIEETYSSGILKEKRPRLMGVRGWVGFGGKAVVDVADPRQNPKHGEKGITRWRSEDWVHFERVGVKQPLE